MVVGAKVMTARRFPVSAEQPRTVSFVRDADGQKLAYVYYENEPGRRCARKTLSKKHFRKLMHSP